jgi:hypothetical protein
MRIGTAAQYQHKRIVKQVREVVYEEGLVNGDAMRVQFLADKKRLSRSMLRSLVPFTASISPTLLAQ